MINRNAPLLEVKVLIDLYINHSEKERITKQLTNVLSLDGTLKQETSIIEPEIIIEASNPSIYNYMHIPLFHRYYYITDITSIRNNLWRISGKVDVLMSFDDEIKQIPVILNSAENTDETYISGSQWKTSVKTKTDILNFPQGFNEQGEYILITSGGLPTGGE